MNKHARALGRLGKGKKKAYSEAERERRRELMREVNRRRLEAMATKGQKE